MTPRPQTTPDRVMMLSIHPHHVEKILDGSKTVELRRTRPAVRPGQPVAIYATMPSAALVATCRISAVETGSPSEIWSSVAHAAAVTRPEFDAYYQDADTAIALHLDDVTPLLDKVTLPHLRAGGGFHPPQTWHFLDLPRLRQLVGHHPSSHILTGMLLGSTA